VQFSSLRYVDVVIAAPYGRIDHSSADAFQQALAPVLQDIDARQGMLLLDFAAVEYISSVGLRVLMVAAKHLRGRSSRIAVAALQPVVGEILEISRFHHVVEVFPNVREALLALSGAAASAFDGGPAQPS
jgi:anti-sigma B factor antagonist